MKARSINSAQKHRPALRLVSTKELPRRDWLAVRKRGIGSSDAAAAVGLNPYKSQLELWLEKTGRDAGLPKTDPQDEESPAYWGNVLEPIVAWHYSKRTGNAVLQHPDPELPWMLANIDREVIGTEDVQILECKTAGINGARLWKEGVPEYVVLQVMHQLAVTGKQAADVAVLLGGQTLEIHRIERDEQMIARLIELERQFWQHVETDTPPPADGTASAESALRCLYPEDNSLVADFSNHAGLTAAFIELKAVRQSIANMEKREAELKQMLQQAMGSASRADFSSGYVSWCKAKDSIGLDVAQLLQDKPYLQAKYPLLKPGARRFLVG
ncbi:YqaJ viral recombinase family protein [Pseudomonas putida]|jgi:putative phage-type endonuclease|uniref:Alkaline phosphatase n=1 Tax=Pseudomonas putida TaxID=303 RepID=A0A0P7C9W3_PSEPU|nr:MULTISPECIES: YqaJ viral recombinase family protein [Pseudomonas]KPM63232.1 alkaline phosphatase [Pseudomonas putida]MBI6943284.1 YqaJ viral recombinase family protein [Pseudomonas putida]MBI6959457.1 YqaJ viral recombinase family protein [Pseudomonas putida]MCG3646754.1 YqaJ viral recombinase family protein [Pseudomonas putida]MDD1983494.1 YqaJ viral recombinase family protein [Pseudomonas asiatica]